MPARAEKAGGMEPSAQKQRPDLQRAAQISGGHHHASRACLVPKRVPSLCHPDGGVRPASRLFVRAGHWHEILFIVEEDPEGGYTAQALGESIFTEGDTIAAIKENIKDALLCHFEKNAILVFVRLHIVREEQFAYA